MEHVLFVIIYAAMLNNHKLLGLKLIFMFDDKDEKLTCLDVDIQLCSFIYTEGGYTFVTD